MTKAIALLSGGLDSTLAVRVIQSQGIDVTGIVFTSPFFSEKKAKQAAEILGIELKVIDITYDLLKIIKNPPHGFGKNINPCIDCHALMLKKAGEILSHEGFDFIITGEVLGERPMSQNRCSLDLVRRISGYEDYIVRPLSAKLLPETMPEKDGLVDRNKLLDLSGRSRKRQMELVEKFGINKFPSPAGGCKLTEPNFAKRFRALISLDDLDDDFDETVRKIKFLSIGRHIKFDDKAWLIVGRNEAENNFLDANTGKKDIKIYLDDDLSGPTALIVNGSKLKNKKEIIEKACAICARYSNIDELKFFSVVIEEKGKIKKIMSNACSQEEFEEFLIKG